MKHSKRIPLKLETVRVLTDPDLAGVAGGISSDCQSRIFQCAVPTSKQPWCNDTYSAGCPK